MLTFQTPVRTEAAKRTPAPKASRRVPPLSPAQAKLYQGIGSTGAFSLENLANGYTSSKPERPGGNPRSKLRLPRLWLKSYPLRSED